MYQVFYEPFDFCYNLIRLGRLRVGWYDSPCTGIRKNFQIWLVRK